MKPRADAATLRVRVQPRASRDAILGFREDVLRLAVTAPPVEGEANEAVRRLLARALRVAPSTVTVVGGERSRDKLIRIDGLRGGQLRSRLAGPGEETR
jgi:uncharacterized protein (TIGR00251 family)